MYGLLTILALVGVFWVGIATLIRGHALIGLLLLSIPWMPILLSMVVNKKEKDNTK